LGETAVGGKDHGAFLITARDKLEEKMSAVTVNRNVTDLINNKEFGLTIELQPLFNAIFSVGSGEVGDKGQGLGKVSAITFGDGLYSQGHGQVSFSHSWRAKEDDILSVSDKTAGSQIFDSFFINGGLEGKIKAF